MKKYIQFLITAIAVFFVCSCGQENCEEVDTGGVSITHNSSYLGDDAVIDFYIDGELISSVTTGNSIVVQDISATTHIVSAFLQPDNTKLFEEDITVIQCEIDTIKTTDYLQGASDIRLKKNITTVETTLANLNKLVPYSYEYNQKIEPKKYLPEGLHYGFMAHELKEIYPAFVSKDKYGFYQVNYIELIPLLTKGIQEQQMQINELQADVEMLKQLLGKESL